LANCTRRKKTPSENLDWKDLSYAPADLCRTPTSGEETIKSEGVVYNSTGTGKYAPIAPEDIASVAIKALKTRGSSGEIFELTGGELLTVPEEVNVLEKIPGKRMRCVDMPTEAAVQGLIRSGMPAAAAVGQGFKRIRDGKATMVTNVVENVTGKKPVTFEAWARKYAARFA
jgi:uncharacterized protein YbjT (DUF2867 family)